MAGVPEIFSAGILSRNNGGACVVLEGSAGHDCVDVLDQGVFLPCSESFLKFIESGCNGRVINYFNDIEMNELGIARLHRAHESHLAIKILLLSHGRALVAGSPVQALIDLEVNRLHEQAKKLLKNVFGRGKGNKRRYIADVDRCAAWLVNNRKAFSSQAIVNDVMERCLLWNKPLKEQPRVMREALPCIGVNGAFSVDGKQFLCRDAAFSYLDEQTEQGKKVTMQVSDTLLGKDAYIYLKHSYGKALPALLCSYGVFGISYNAGYTSFLG